MNTAIIMLGSNTNAEQNIDLAKEKISEFYEIVSVSSPLITKPHGKHYKSDFRNEAIKLLSDETAEETKATFKQIEIELGRTPENKKQGVMPIDIDLIYWNGTVLNQDYERFDFVKQCTDEIANH
jgi:2-amino-4-hydroxy-6-hydroxymethyldihydropteridine diphosphokinase